MINSSKFLSQKAAARPGTWDETGKAKKLKKPNTCHLWPDKIPEGKHDVLNTKYEKLTFIQPVYRYNYYWFWLAICDCGQECVVRPYFSKSCGCRTKKKPIFNRVEHHQDVNTRPPKFDRFKHCVRKPFTCVFYQECLDERVFGGTASRYKPEGCYVPSAEEFKLQF